MTGMVLGQGSPRGLDPWGERMLAPDEVAAMVHLHKLGWGSKRIAGELACSRNTVRRYLGAGGWAAIRPPQRKRRLDGLEEWLAQRFRQHRGNCDVVRQDLLREHGLTVSLRTVERAAAPLRQALQAEARACVRFETPPGQQLQIDFGGTTVSIGGEPVRVHLFVATLGYSRRPFVRAFRHERQTAWFDGLEGAFRHFDGVPQEVVFDNARALVDYHDAATREVRFNERLHAFARYWRFHPHACAPYRAAAQGGGDQQWVGIKHPIGEPAGRAGMAIVRLVGMERDDPSRRARTCSAAIVEALQPCLGDANRIGLVPVPIVGVPRKAGPQPLHAGSGWFDNQEIAGNGHHLSRTNVQDGSRGDARMRGMMYSTKTALVIRADLSPWQVANVAAFLSGGLAGGYPEIVGEPYRDGDGRLYTPMIREPIFVYAASSAELARTHGRAVSRNLRFAIYTELLFNTANDADNRASGAATPTAALDLVGLGLHADRKIVDKVTAGLKFLP